MKVFINPGHCVGIEPGACGNGLEEAQVALNIGQRLENYLKAAGYVTKLFQYDGLAEIVDCANDWDADIFISIHCNAANGNARGTETYTTDSSEGTKLANAIQNKLLQKIETIDRGVKVRGFYVIKHTDAPAVLVETAFVNNPADLPRTFDIEKIAKLARKYESNGDPACVADNAGDFGGISYGLYQFASNVGVVDNFVNWLCKYPDPALANYGKVLAAHKVNSEEFIRQWKELGEIDPLNFGKLQDEYIKIKYYDVATKKLSAKYFNVDKHTDALKAVILSRAIQNGASGCVKLFEIAAKIFEYKLDESDFVKKIIGVGNVCEAAALCSVNRAKFALPKTKFDEVTIALIWELL